MGATEGVRSCPLYLWGVVTRDVVLRVAERVVAVVGRRGRMATS